MTLSSLKRPTPMVVTMAIAALATLAIVANIRFVDVLLDSSTGIFAVLCALIATSQLAHRPLGVWSRVLWLLVLTAAVLVACVEFSEPLAEFKGHDFGLDNLDDVLLLAAAPVGLWLTTRNEPRPLAAQLLLVLGLAAQLCGAILDLSSAEALARLGITVERGEGYADFAQFLSLLFYFMAMWLLVGGGTWAHLGHTQARAEEGPVSPYGSDLRDTLYPPPFLVGWGLADAGSPAGRVHRLCNEALWPTGDIVRSARNLGVIALWPVIAAARAAPQVRHYGAAVQRLTGKSRLRQFMEQMAIAIRYRIAPMYYYVYEFYRRGQWRSAPHYLMRYETKEIAYRLLYPIAYRQYVPAPLKDKVEFARHCQAHGIRHVPLLMLFQDGQRVIAPDLADHLPEEDIFVKRTNGKGGARSELWRCAGSGTYRNTLGEVADERSITAHLIELSRDKPFFIQWAVKNHRDLLDLSAGALSTVRMLSVRNEAGDYEVTDAAFRMSVKPESPVDNFHSGGIAAAVDIETGCLGQATDLGMGPDFKWHDVHPLTGARIAGRQLPMWKETVELAVRAHRSFSDYVLVGWDIAVLEGGPCVIEGNRGPDVDIHQRTALAPIGDGRFGELLAFNLEHRTGPR
ncbi:MAG TPA: sugar-transfer associated ATP-grasp domain-containing protein [Dongiaceae bacterium]|jgi:hypothetical protein